MAFERDYGQFSMGETPYFDPYENEGSWGYAHASPSAGGSSPSYSYGIPYGSEAYYNQLYGSNWPKGGGVVDTTIRNKPYIPNVTPGMGGTSRRSAGTGLQSATRSFGDYPFFTPGTPGQMETPQMPKMAAYPELELPERDEQRIRDLTTLAAAPGLRNMRKQIQEVQGKYYENPNVKRMTLRDALAGYGLGLENVMAGARKEAMAEYEAEYQPKVSKAQAEWQAEISRIQNQYQAAMQDYLRRISEGNMMARYAMSQMGQWR